MAPLGTHAVNTTAPARAEHSGQLGRRCGGIGAEDEPEHGHDRIHGAVGQRHRLGPAGHELGGDALRCGVGTCHRHEPPGGIHAGDVCASAGDEQGGVPRAAAQVDDVLAGPWPAPIDHDLGRRLQLRGDVLVPAEIPSPWRNRMMAPSRRSHCDDRHPPSHR